MGVGRNILNLRVPAIQPNSVNCKCFYRYVIFDHPICDFSPRMIASSQTGEALSRMPEDTKAYESVGRMFVKQDMTVIQKNLDSQVDELKDKIKKLETNKEYLSRNLKESEDNLRELVAQKQKARA